MHTSCECFVCIQVTSFIREESRNNMQIIVISLKEEFFSKSDALLGVYSDVINFSNALLQVVEELIDFWICYDSAVTDLLFFTV